MLAAGRGRRYRAAGERERDKRRKRTIIKPEGKDILNEEEYKKDIVKENKVVFVCAFLLWTR